MKTFFYLNLLVLLCACANIDSTVFIPDGDDPNLPAYTEWGYNSFGAKYERLYFLADNSITPCKITYREGMLHFSLAGTLRADTYGSRFENMTLTVSFPSGPVSEYRDLLILHERSIDLSSCSVDIEKSNSAGRTAVSSVKGHLTFRRAQLLRIDGEENRVILSGSFDMQFLTDGKPESITDGRFDVGIHKDFYSFD
ncbi:MAG: hypothetical protein LBL57_03435 [Tannerella sp.]|jgi:hypothetical protein|nr:hypothetical protein [Tannerella sp.]